MEWEALATVLTLLGIGVVTPGLTTLPVLPIVQFMDLKPISI